MIIFHLQLPPLIPDVLTVLHLRAACIGCVLAPKFRCKIVCGDVFSSDSDSFSDVFFYNNGLVFLFFVILLNSCNCDHYKGTLLLSFYCNKTHSVNLCFPSNHIHFAGDSWSDVIAVIVVGFAELVLVFHLVGAYLLFKFSWVCVWMYDFVFVREWVGQHVRESVMLQEPSA